MNPKFRSMCRKFVTVISSLALVFGGLIGVQATAAHAADDLIQLNSTGGTDATDGIRVSYQTGKYQVHKNGTGQIFSPSSTPGSINSIMMAVRVGDTCTNFSSHDRGNFGCTRTAWTEVDTTGSSTTGSGSFTTVLTGTTGGLTYRVHVTNSYVKPNNFFTQEFRVEIPEGNENDVRLYYGLDSYLAGGDQGPGYFLPSPQEVGVNKAGQKMAFRYSAGPAWTSYISAYFSNVFTAPGPGSGTDYNNSINENPSTDNGFGVGWNVGSAPGMTPKMTNFFAFSSPGVPTAPGAPSVEPGSAPDEVDVSWESSDDTTDYIVSSLPGGSSCQSATTECTVENLPDGIYRFTVTPRNLTGAGFPSLPSDPIVVGDVPTHEFNYDANGATSGAVPAPASQVYEGWPLSIQGNTNHLTRPGYEFVGWNTTAAGTGSTFAPGSEFEMPEHNATLYAMWNALPVPDAPPAPEATLLPNGNVKIKFTPPESGYEPTHYTATSQPGGKTCTVSASADPLECTVTGLQPGTSYRFTATANNDDGPSAASPESNVVTTPQKKKVGPTAKPSRPAKVKISGNAFSKTKKVSWAKGPTTGPRAVSHYRVLLNVYRCRTVIFDRKFSKNRTSYKFKRSWLLKRKNSTCSRKTRGEVRSNKVRYRVRVQAVNSIGTATTVKSFTIKRKR